MGEIFLFYVGGSFLGMLIGMCLFLWHFEAVESPHRAELRDGVLKRSGLKVWLKALVEQDRIECDAAMAQEGGK